MAKNTKPTRRAETFVLSEIDQNDKADMEAIGSLPMYEIHLARYDVPPNGIKWHVTMIDNTKPMKDRKTVRSAGDDVGAHDLINEFMRMRE